MSGTASTLYPFFSRAYGGFTDAQEAFIFDLIGDAKEQSILDPMAGQAFSLSKLATKGANVFLGDINPATLLLAFLRDPGLIVARQAHVDWMSSVLAEIGRRRRKVASRNRFVESWVAPEMAVDLRDLAAAAGIGLFANPFAKGSDFWTGDSRVRFAAAIAVMAAREIACFRETDNLTWLKPGGLLREPRAIAPLRRALSAWGTYAETNFSEHRPDINGGSIESCLMDVAAGDLGSRSKVPWIITSPPYANRLDYSRLWGPELNVLGVMAGATVDGIKRKQIGTTVVEGVTSSAVGDIKLPKNILAALNAIRDDPTEFSRSYYYPFFLNYATSLASSLRAMAARLRVGGTIAVFVRDTVRKDVLFPTGELVDTILTGAECGLIAHQVERRIIRHHIGFLRKSSTRGLYGLAQQEWWLVFKKPRRAGSNGSPH